MFDDFLAELWTDARKVFALPVVAPPLWLGSVEQGLHLGIWPLHEHVTDRIAKRLDWRDDLLALLGFPRVTGKQPYNQPSVPLFRKPWRRRGRAHKRHEREFLRSL